MQYVKKPETVEATKQTDGTYKVVDKGKTTLMTEAAFLAMYAPFLDAETPSPLPHIDPADIHYLIDGKADPACVCPTCRAVIDASTKKKK